MGRAAIGLFALGAVAGCGTQVYVGEEPAPAYTYYRDAKPVLDEHCVACHGEDDDETIPLASYAEAYLFRDVVVEAVLDGSMPPGCLEGGERSNRRLLDDEEARALVGWVEAGALMGDPGDVEQGE